jgi:DNA-binding LytR/AlgR family response regulator
MKTLTATILFLLSSIPFYAQSTIRGRILDPSLFFRVNRRYIVSINSFSQIIAWSNSRLKIEIAGLDEEIIVARERVREFKSWLDR